MSTFMGLVKNMIWEKWKLMNWIIIISIMSLAVISVMRLIGGDSLNMGSTFITYALIVGVASFISTVMLARQNERIYTSNNYRLISATSTKLYFSNLLTTVIANIYLALINDVILGSLFAGGRSQVVKYNPAMQGEQNIGMMIKFVILAFLISVVIWAGITLVHFLITIISSSLPFGRQKIVLFLIYLVVIWLALATFNFTTGNIFKFVYTNIGITNMNHLNSMLEYSIAIFAGWFVLFTGLDIYLLGRWIETNH